MKIRLLLLVALGCAACAPLPYRGGHYPGPYGRNTPYPSRYLPEPASSAIVGRWDNVMMLAAGTPVQVLMFDGTKAGGDVTSADATALRVRTASGEAVFDADKVMRVDRVTSGQDYASAAGRGAAIGAGVVGVLGMLAGHLPPARVFGAGAIMGAGAGVQNISQVPASSIIYLSSRAGGTTP